MSNSYYLPEGYQCNPLVLTVDKDEGKPYWNNRRVAASRVYQYAAYRWAQQEIKKRGVKKLADVGCGYATKLEVLHRCLPNVDIWGLDQPNAIQLCREHYEFGNWTAVDFEDEGHAIEEKFDFVISSDVIEHLDNPDLLLNFIKNILSKDGVVLLSTPERVRLRGNNCQTSPNPFHIREWAYDEFASYIEDRGFEIIEHRCLPAVKPMMNYQILRGIINRWLRGKTLNYNQAILARLK